MKLYLITNMPASYRVDLFNLLQEKLGEYISFCFVREPGIDFRKGIGVYESENFLQQSCFYNERFIFSTIKLFFDLLKDNPDVLINGGMSYRALFLCIYAKLFRKKLFIWWGGTTLAGKNISWLKLMYRRLIATLADGGLFYSKLAYDDYAQLTKKEFQNIVLGNNTRDTAKYHAEIMLKKKNSISEVTKLLTIGFLTESKNVIACLEALKVMKKVELKYELLIVGDGPERCRLEKFCSINKLKNVFFLGHVKPTDMYSIYADADIYVHPSLRDRWPQTYNEAAAAGLPVLISDHSGVCDEYTEKYRDVALFNPNDFRTLAERIKLLINDRKLRKGMGQEALNCALKHDAVYACRQIMDLING